MAHTFTTTASLSKVVKQYYDRRFLERLTPQLKFKQFAVPKELPKHEGNIVVWHRWNLFSKGRLLNEISSGDGRGISATRISATLYQIGDHARISTFVDQVSINSVVQGAIDLFSDSAALTVDWCVGRQLLWKRASLSATFEVSTSGGYGFVAAVNYLSAGGHSSDPSLKISASEWEAPLWDVAHLDSRNYKLSGVMGGVSSTLLTPNIIRGLVLKLKVKNAMPFEDGYYKCIIHPDLINQLRSSSAFIDLYKYTDSPIFTKGGMANSEAGLVGALEKVKFY